MLFRQLIEFHQLSPSTPPSIISATPLLLRQPRPSLPPSSISKATEEKIPETRPEMRDLYRRGSILMLRSI